MADAEGVGGHGAASSSASDLFGTAEGCTGINTQTRPFHACVDTQQRRYWQQRFRSVGWDAVLPALWTGMSFSLA